MDSYERLSPGTPEDAARSSGGAEPDRVPEAFSADTAWGAAPVPEEPYRLPERADDTQTACGAQDGETVRPAAEQAAAERTEASRSWEDPWNAVRQPDPWEKEAAPAPWEKPRRRPHRTVQTRRLRRRRRWSGLLGFLAGLAAAGLLAVGARYWERTALTRQDPFIFDYREEQVEERTNTGITIPTWPAGQGASFRVLREHGDILTIQEVYRRVNPSVVTVLVGLDERTAAVGTGVIFSSDGYFVTNYHVVEGGTECTAVLDSGYACDAKFVAGDVNSDLAVLKMESKEELTAAVFGDSDLLTVGDDVFAIGNPLGVEFRGTLTNGIVSAINRDVQVDGRTMTLIQTNAALNSGNSGGPLINGFGQVVGINVVKMSSSRSTVEGLGFAIPSASMERLVNDLLTFGAVTPEPVLGVSVSRIGTALSDGSYGITVESVVEQSAAAAAGVQEGDVILSADGEAVRTSQDLLRVRRRFHVGDELRLTLWRDGERLDVALILQAAE